MNVQFNTNYAQRNVPQKTNKTQAFKAPNFAGTLQVAVSIEDTLGKALLESVKDIFKKHPPVSTVEGTDVSEGFRYIKASFKPDKDLDVLSSLTDVLKKFGKDNKFVLDYTTAQHGLSENELAMMKFEQNFVQKPGENPQDISQIRRNIIIED